MPLEGKTILFVGNAFCVCFYIYIYMMREFGDLFRENLSCHFLLLGFSTIYCFPSEPIHVPGCSCHAAGVVEQDPTARVSVLLCHGWLYSQMCHGC